MILGDSCFFIWSIRAVVNMYVPNVLVAKFLSRPSDVVSLSFTIHPALLTSTCNGFSSATNFDANEWTFFGSDMSNTCRWMSSFSLASFISFCDWRPLSSFLHTICTVPPCLAIAIAVSLPAREIMALNIIAQVNIEK